MDSNVGSDPDTTPEARLLDSDAIDTTAASDHVGGRSPVPADSLLGRLIDSVAAYPSLAAPSRLDAFLHEQRIDDSLLLWLGGTWDGDVDSLLRWLNSDVARIDQHIDQQINAILHTPEFQRLEAAWRGLEYLTTCADEEGDPLVKIKFLNVTKAELAEDFDDAIDFDQNRLFQKVYDQEFGMPGGEPFGVLIGDYEFGPRDVKLLESISTVAAAAFCPFISNAAPAMFDLDSFDALERNLDHARNFEQMQYHAWQQFRLIEEARFVGLTLPHILMRLPYEGDQSDRQGFIFTEETYSARDYLWGGAAFAFGEVLIRAFAESRWLADIRGVQRGVSGGGLVENLPIHSANTDREGVVVAPPTDLIVTDELEQELSELGFIPLCHCYDTEFAAFYSAQSVQNAKQYTRPDATMNARISTMLQYIFCVSRFAHYLKSIGRDTIGDMSNPKEIQDQLNRWLAQYVTPDTEASAEVKARNPLQSARVEVVPEPGKPGAFQAVLQLMPHYQLEDIKANLMLVTQLMASNR